MPSIFMSHSTKDKFFVRELASQLRTLGIDVWIDDAEIKVGDSLLQKIGNAIDDVDYFGIVLSGNSINSNWVTIELNAAMQKELKGNKPKILPILLEKVEVPTFLKDKKYADFSDPKFYDNALSQLLEALEVEQKSSNDSRIIGQTHKIIFDKDVILLFDEESLVRNELEEFQDITILDLDTAISYNPDPETLLYNLYLRLSKNPPSDWASIFEAERQFPRHSMWRKAWIDGQYIVIYCVPDELEEYHLKDLKKDVTSTNMKYREYLMEKLQKEEMKKKQEKEQETKLDDLRKRLDFGN